MRQLSPNLGLDPDSLSVRFIGRGGATVGRLTKPDISRAIAQFAPEIVLLQVGANDLDTRAWPNTAVAAHLMSLAGWLIAALGVRRVGVMALLRRAKIRHCDHVTVNAHVDNVNAKLKQLCETAENDTFFWRHKGLKDAIENSLASDGEHLNKAGMRKFVLSVRGGHIACGQG